MRRSFVITITTLILIWTSCLVAGAVAIKDITFTTKGAGKVLFSHKEHLKQSGMTNECTACHDSIYAIKKKVRYTMADMEKGKSCGACHIGKKAFALKECVRCHHVKEITYTVKATGPTHFSHKKHLSSTPDCNSCHPALFVAGPNKRVTMAEMYKGKSCGACHDSKKAFSIRNCSSCHPVKDLKFATSGAGIVGFSHAKHAEGNSCDKCHTRLYATTRSKSRVSMAQMYKGKSCGACHDGKNAFDIKKCGSCHSTTDQKYIIKGAGNVQFKHSSHTGLYGCDKCHPKLYPTGQSKSKVSMKAMEKGKSCGACHNGKAAFTVAENCATCHKTE
ncbi:MAG: cytochrome c3 family protein [Steroidobacteraceae bacterium]|nr:cytochrome c3 family protein [Deltaproteobacteria bacterium]